MRLIAIFILRNALEGRNSLPHHKLCRAQYITAPHHFHETHQNQGAVTTQYVRKRANATDPMSQFDMSFRICPLGASLTYPTVADAVTICCA